MSNLTKNFFARSWSNGTLGREDVLQFILEPGPSCIFSHLLNTYKYLIFWTLNGTKVRRFTFSSLKSPTCWTWDKTRRHGLTMALMAAQMRVTSSGGARSAAWRHLPGIISFLFRARHERRRTKYRRFLHLPRLEMFCLVLLSPPYVFILLNGRSKFCGMFWANKVR